MTDKKTKVKTDPRVDPSELLNNDTVDDKQLIEQLREEFDDLVKKYNKQQEQLEGAEMHNQMFRDEINELKSAIKVLNDALTKPTIVRNRNKGYWVTFNMENYELTRPLIALVEIMKSLDVRQKQFYLEIIGDDVVEVSDKRT